jgi:PTEN phosphatase family protein
MPKIGLARPPPLAVSDGAVALEDASGAAPRRQKRGSIIDVEFGFGVDGEVEDETTLSSHPQRYSDRQQRACHKPRKKLYRIINSWPVQAILLSLILIDVGLTIFQIVMDIVSPDQAEVEWMFALTLTIVLVLLLEVCLRIFALGVHDFFSAWFNTLDLGVSLLSLALELIVYAAFQSQIAHAAKMNLTDASISGGDLAAANNFAALRVLRPAARILRIFRVSTRAVRQHGQMQTTARHVVGGNKQRFQRDGFDLDLVYITEQLIGMSVPAYGQVSLYRNPIDEVARFFRVKHSQDGYMLFNCTSECSYPDAPFGGNVKRFCIDDHNVPPMETMVEFCEELQRLSDERPSMIFAVHCRGGKGRTGTMCCSWLLWTKRCSTAAEALELFEDRRTDKTIRGKKQGVETESQKRYVRYFEQYLAAGKKLDPQPRQVRQLVIRNLLPDNTTVPGHSLPWVRAASNI